MAPGGGARGCYVRLFPKVPTVLKARFGSLLFHDLAGWPGASLPPSGSSSSPIPWGE